jgi:hypothetical protein
MYSEILLTKHAGNVMQTTFKKRVACKNKSDKQAFIGLSSRQTSKILHISQSNSNFPTFVKSHTLKNRTISYYMSVYESSAQLVVRC